MQTEDLLKVKFVLVCALASEVESGRHVGIPSEQLMEAIRIINGKIGFRDDNRCVTKNQAAAVKSLLRSCGINPIPSEFA
jgi:hypothetical protein